MIERVLGYLEILVNVTIGFGLGQSKLLIHNPRLDLHEVGDEGGYFAFDNGGVATNHVLVLCFGHVVLGHD